MTDPTPLAAVTLGGLTATLSDLLHHLKRRGRLQGLLQEVIVEQFLVLEAARAGLGVTAEELQRAADSFRRSRGLTSAEETRAGLARQRLSVADFEEALERDLLIVKLKTHLFEGRIPDHFEGHRPRYDRLRIRQLTVPREDLARELLSQAREEGRDFAEVVRQYLAEAADEVGPSVAVLFRGRLSPAVAAALPETVGQVAGPVGTPLGFALVRVEEVQPAQLDATTIEVIRQELFDAWLRPQLGRLPISYPLLDGLT